MLNFIAYKLLTLLFGGNVLQKSSGTVYIYFFPINEILPIFVICKIWFYEYI